MRKVAVIKSLVCLFIFDICFMSCENFFNGSLIQEELQELIEEANAPEVSITIFVDNGTGTAIPSGVVLIKLEKVFLLLLQRHLIISSSIGKFLIKKQMKNLMM